MLANRAPCPLCTTLPLQCWWKGFWKDATEFLCLPNILKYCPCPVIIPDVGKSRTFSTPRQHQRTNNFYDPLDWTTTEMLLEGGRRCCFHGLLGNVAIFQYMLIALMSILRRWTYLYLWTSPFHGQIFKLASSATLNQVLQHSLIYFQECGNSVALSRSAYSITCYWIIKCFHNPP